MVEAFSFLLSKTMHKAMRRATPKLQRSTGKQLWIHNRRQAYLISRIRAKKLRSKGTGQMHKQKRSSLK